MNSTTWPALTLPQRVDVLGVGISAITMEKAVHLTTELLDSAGRGYICVTGVHGVTESIRDKYLMAIQNDSFLTTPDGMPLVWIGKNQGYEIERVYGPDFMMSLCEEGVLRGYRHFLYGGNVGVAEKLRDALVERIPGVQIVGTYTPPFRPLNPEETQTFVDLVEETKPHLLWVGLSTPKQERFMAEFLPRLNVQVMIGVGAAFDIHTGGIKDAPAWMKRSGLQWLHRVIQEPRRLARRYLVGNSIFISKMALQMLKSKGKLVH